MKGVNIYKAVVVVGVLLISHHYYSHHYLTKGISAEKQRRKNKVKTMVLYQKSKTSPEWYRIFGEAVIDVVSISAQGIADTYKEVRK